MEIAELNNLYSKADQSYQKLFSEQRNNVLIAYGDHWSSKNIDRIKRNKKIDQSVRLRISKNHIGRITKKIQNDILMYSPNVGILPKNDGELSDQKTAEIAESVWQHLFHTHKIEKKMRLLVKDFVEIGEVCLKISWNNSKGRFLGYENTSESEDQQDEEPKAIFSGDIDFERILGFNILIDPKSQTFDDAAWVCLRKMITKRELLSHFHISDKRRKFIDSDDMGFYKVFSPTSHEYKDSDQIMIREYYFRPSAKYIKGYYFIATELGVLFSGELPYSIFPIVFATYNDHIDSPRGSSIIRDLRQTQIEINRCTSKIAEHQALLGEDKILIQRGSKLSEGNGIHGVKSITYSGARPEILPGREGGQFFGYLQSQISELYAIANMNELDQNISNQADPYLALFQSIKERKKFSLYTSKFETFLTELCHLSLKTSKLYFEHGRIIPIVGKSESINIEEFKNINDLSYQIKLRPQVDDIESKVGRQLSLNQLLQYAGSHLDREDIGQIIRSMPYANSENTFQDLTQNYDNIVADILAMERGIFRSVNIHDDHLYNIKKLTKRVKSLDFESLPPPTQQMFFDKIKSHEEAYAQQLQDRKKIENEYIPDGGYTVSCDYYKDNSDGSRAKRVKVPSASLEWLLQKLESQNIDLNAVERLAAQNKNDVLFDLDQVNKGEKYEQ